MADTKYEIRCPACNRKMTKIFLEKLNINLDICLDGCGGIYFDNLELKKINANSESVKEVLKIFENKIFNKVNENLKRVCPVCMADMIKNYDSPKRKFVIDECYSCGGKFLDYGELEKIQKNSKDEKEAIKVLINALYANKGDKELNKLNNKVESLKPNIKSIKKIH